MNASEATNRPRGRVWIALILLGVLPLSLRWIPIGHGLPQNYVPDTHVVKNALGMARDKDPVPPNLKYSSYPNLLAYCLLPIYVSQYALGRATGSWSGAGEFAMALEEDPSLAHFPARALVALFGALTPLIVFLGARAAGLRRGAWVAAWLVATGLLHVHFSVQERPWVPMAFFFALASWPAARYMQEPRLRSLLLSGVAAGLAFATHQAGVAALGIPGAAWLFGGLRWRGADLGRRLGHGCACVGLFALVAVAVGHPYWVRYGFGSSGEFAGAEEFDFEDDRPTIHVAGQALRFSLSTNTLRRLSHSFLGYDPIVALLGVVGLVGALRRRGTRPAALLAVVWGAFFLTNYNDHVRYLLPLGVLLAWPAGIAAEWLARRPAGLGALAVLLTVPLVQSLRLGAVLRTPDTRESAAALLAEVPAGARIAIDRYGPWVPLDLESLGRIAERRDLGFRERGRVERLRAGVLEDPGLDAIRVEDWLRFDERTDEVTVAKHCRDLGETPGEVFDALGVTHLLLVSRKPAGGGPRLLAPLVDGVEPLFVVNPSAGDARAAEAYLPIEMRFPLSGLWSVERPGPWMALYELPRAVEAK